MSARHKALRITFAAAISAGGLLAAFAGPVSADSIGACGDSSKASYLNGNIRNSDPPAKPDGTPSIGYERIYGDLQVDSSTSFGPCVPDDNAGANGPSVWVGIVRNNYGTGAHIQAGIVRCRNVGTTYCDGTPHLFSEWASGFGVNLVRDHGPASYGRVYTVMLDVDTTSIDVYFDGHLKTTWETGSALNVQDPLELRYMTETWDRGDGLGSSNQGSTDIGAMKYRVKYGTDDYLIWNRTGDCNWDTYSQSKASDFTNISCYSNGSFSMYFRTPN